MAQLSSADMRCYEKVIETTTAVPVTTVPETTRDITQCRAMQSGKVDVVILNDVSCSLTKEECTDQQEQIAYALKSIKGANDRLTSNVAYLEFDGSNVTRVVSLSEAPYNEAPITEEDIDEYFYIIKGSEVCTDTHLLQRNGKPDLETAIDAAINQFDVADSMNKRRDMKVLIFSNCKVDNVDIDDICKKYEDDIFKSNKKYGGNGFFDAYMVNNGDTFKGDDDYIMCLVEYDEKRSFTNSERDNAEYYDTILPELTNKICGSPTPAPTADPTKEPISRETTVPATTIPETTVPATRNITQCTKMINGQETDTIILNDVSCSLTKEQCKDQQEQIAYALKSIKGENDRLISNVAYFEFDGSDVNPVVNLSAVPFNEAPITEEDIDNYFNIIKDSAVCDDAHLSQRNGNPNLEAAIDAAIKQFDVADSAQKQNDMKVLIFSDCKVDNVTSICNKYEDDIFKSNKQRGGGGFFDAYMVNNGDKFDGDDNYIMCLVEYDEGRLFTNPARDNDEYYGKILPALQGTICGSPTPAPTADPTKEPISGGLARRLSDQSRREMPENQVLREDGTRRRLQGMTADLTSGSKHSPCITLQIKLATEHLVPTNDYPDPASNIILIGRAIANITGGKVTMPSIPDRDDDEYQTEPRESTDLIDENPFKDMPAECKNQSQIIKGYLATQNFAKEVPMMDIIEEVDGFKITTSITTDDSNVYKFSVNELPLSISHSCDDNLIMNAAILQKDKLVNESANVFINSGGSAPEMFPFRPAVLLKPGTKYKFEFKLIDGYPANCGFDSISFGNINNDGSRRRMPETTAEQLTWSFLGKPCACTYAQNLAKTGSAAMRTGVNALCNDDLQDKRDVVEEGLFTQKCSQTAIKNHLFKTGSLYLYNNESIEIFNTATWPSGNIKKPCIAVDEEGLRIFAVGGYDKSTGSGLAVDTIQVFQFDDDTFKTGSPVTWLNGWKLDKPRYGSTCFYWKEDEDTEHIVVISGMNDIESEFKDKSKFYNDIVMFPIPANKDVLDDCHSDCAGKSCMKPSKDFGCPSGAEKKVAKLGTIDMRPLLMPGNKLWLFGGKTHKASKPFVQQIDLDTMEAKEILDILEDRAQPLIDHVYDVIDGKNKSCYLVFAGAKYENAELVTQSHTGLIDNMQLICTHTVENPTRRRTMHIESDQNVEKGRRRLSDNLVLTDKKSEIYRTDYNFTLDGIWYNFTVNFELCYDNNTLLKAAEDSYDSIIASKYAEDQQKWTNYTTETAQKILQESLDAYFTFSNGFGDVCVWDLDKVGVKYNDIKLTHPHRRNARWWGRNRNIKDNDEINWDEDFVWIDDKINCKDD